MKDFRLIRSRRRTLALQVRKDGTLTVRAPHFVQESEISRFIEAKRLWIEKTAARFKVQAALHPQTVLDKAQKRHHEEEVFMRLTLRCRYFAEKMGASYRSIGLSNARARWASCSLDGRLRFNWRLAFVPQEILDYVVVHELAHLKEPNHSDRFWKWVERYNPDYVRSKKWLRENQARLSALV